MSDIKKEFQEIQKLSAQLNDKLKLFSSMLEKVESGSASTSTPSGEDGLIVYGRHIVKMDMKGDCTILLKQKDENSDYCGHTQATLCGGCVITIFNDKIHKFDIAKKELSVIGESTDSSCRFTTDGVSRVFSLNGSKLISIDINNGKQTVLKESCNGGRFPCFYNNKIYYFYDSENIMEYDLSDGSCEKLKHGKSALASYMVKMLEIKGKLYFLCSDYHIFEFNIKEEKLEQISHEEMGRSVYGNATVCDGKIFYTKSTNNDGNVIVCFDPEKRSYTRFDKPDNYKKFLQKQSSSEGVKALTHC